MPDTVTLSAEFQISIPKAVCNAQHWNPGQRFAFILKGSGVLLVPIPTHEELLGIAKGANTEGYRDRQDRH